MTEGGKTHKHRMDVTLMMAMLKYKMNKHHTGDVIGFISFILFITDRLSFFMLFGKPILYMFYRSLSCQIKCKPKGQEVFVVVGPDEPEGTAELNSGK